MTTQLKINHPRRFYHKTRLALKGFLGSLTPEEVILVRWLKDLRSGEFPQTTGVLRDKNGYCCLGVLANQCILVGWDEPLFDSYAYCLSDNLSFQGEFKVLPEAVQLWAGLRSSNVYFMDKGSARMSLTNLNDHGYNFKHIANLIESMPPGMFGKPSA